MRSISNASLSLGLLNAPVKIYPATTSQDVKFSLCGPEGQDVEQVYRIKGTDEIVGTRADCERKFENFKLNRDQIVQIEDEATKETRDGINVNLKETMAIESFIPVKDIPFERVTGRYYLGPGKGSDEALATIIKAMEKKKVAAVTKFCLRGRQGQFILFVQDGILNAVRLSFASDVNEVTNDVRVEGKPSKQHIDAAVTLIEAYTSESNIINEMADTLVERKNALIQDAQAGEPIDSLDVAEPAVSSDLMEVMKAEIERAKDKEKVKA